jgi:FdhE protein
MTIDIQTLIEQRPHLKDPLELYARWQRFQQEAALNCCRNSGRRCRLMTQRPIPRKKPVRSFDVRRYLRPAGRRTRPALPGAGERRYRFYAVAAGRSSVASALAFAEDELTTILFLLSRPYFLALRETFVLGRQPSGRMAVVLSARHDRRSPLSSKGPSAVCTAPSAALPAHHRFIGCPNCGTDGCVQAQHHRCPTMSPDSGWRPVMSAGPM